MLTPENGDDPDAKNIVVVLTDGRSNDKMNTFRRAMELRNNHSTILVVGIGLVNNTWAQVILIKINE